MAQFLTTQALWLDASYIEHATGEIVHLPLQYLAADQVNPYLARLKARNYQIMPQSDGTIKALAPMKVSRSQVAQILMSSVDDTRPFTPAQQLAYDQRAQPLIGSAD